MRLASIALYHSVIAPSAGLDGSHRKICIRNPGVFPAKAKCADTVAYPSRSVAVVVSLSPEGRRDGHNLTYCLTESPGHISNCTRYGPLEPLNRFEVRGYRTPHLRKEVR